MEEEHKKHMHAKDMFFFFLPSISSFTTKMYQKTNYLSGITNEHRGFGEALIIIIFSGIHYQLENNEIS